MSLYGPLYGSSTSSGGGTAPVSPALGIETTASSIRARIITVITGLVPASVPGDLFRPFRNERDGVFQTWAQGNATGCRRTFQVRTIGEDDAPLVSNADFEERMVTFRVLVAYPQTHRDGALGALDRDDSLDEDGKQIEHAIGMCGRANLAPPYPDACWRADGNGERSRIAPMIDGAGVDFLQIFASYSYRRTML